MSNTIQHFTHNHPLTEVNGVGTYTCDGCKLYGEGKTYRCSDCDYDLHEYCATCPPSLRNTFHSPNHELSLFSGPTHMTLRSCYVCRFHIQGMFYKCKHCSFESHPLCTYVPVHASSPDATVPKQRKLYDHAGQPSSPHHHAQGNSFGYTHMGPFVPHPYECHHHEHHHPISDPNPGSSTTKKKKEKGGVPDGVKTVLGVTFGIAANLFVASFTGDTSN